MDILSRSGTFVPPRTTPLQGEVDRLVENFVEQSTEWKSLAAMMAGGLAYRWGKIGILSFNGGAIGRSSLRVASIAGGLGAEVTAFELTNRFLQTLRATGQSPLQQNHPNLWSWSGAGGLKEGLLSSLVNFGTLKGFGKLAETQNLILQHGLQDFGMLVGHQFAYQTGLEEKPEGSFGERLIHAESTNLQMGAGLSLGHSLTGGRILAIERGLDLSLRGQGLTPALMSDSAEGTWAIEGNGHAGPLTLKMEGGREGEPPPGFSFTGEEQERIAQIFEESFTSEKLPAVLKALEKTGWSSRLIYRIFIRLSYLARRDFPKALELLGWVPPSEGLVVHFNVRDTAFYHRLGKKHGDLVTRLPKLLEEMKKQGMDFKKQAADVRSLMDPSGRNANAFYQLPRLLAGMDQAGWSSDQKSSFLLLVSKKEGKGRPQNSLDQSKEEKEDADSPVKFLPLSEDLDGLFEDPLPGLPGKRPHLDELESRPGRHEPDPADFLHRYGQEKAIKEIVGNAHKTRPLIRRIDFTPGRTLRDEKASHTGGYESKYPFEIVMEDMDQSLQSGEEFVIARSGGKTVLAKLQASPVTELLGPNLFDLTLIENGKKGSASFRISEGKMDVVNIGTDELGPGSGSVLLKWIATHAARKGLDFHVSGIINPRVRNIIVKHRLTAPGSGRVDITIQTDQGPKVLATLPLEDADALNQFPCGAKYQWNVRGRPNADLLPYPNPVQGASAEDGQAKQNFFEVTPEDEKNLGGLLFPWDPSEPLLPGREIWRIKSVEGDRLILRSGQKMGTGGLAQEMEGEKVFRITKGESVAGLRPNDAVVLLPEVKGGSGYLSNAVIPLPAAGFIVMPPFYIRREGNGYRIFNQGREKWMVLRRGVWNGVFLKKGMSALITHGNQLYGEKSRRVFLAFQLGRKQKIGPQTGIYREQIEKFDPSSHILREISGRRFHLDRNQFYKTNEMIRFIRVGIHDQSLHFTGEINYGNQSWEKSFLIPWEQALNLGVLRGDGKLTENWFYLADLDPQTPLNFHTALEPSANQEGPKEFGESKPHNELFYEVIPQDGKKLGGLLFLFQENEPLLPGREVWKIRSIEGHQIFLHDGKRKSQDGRWIPIQGERVFQGLWTPGKPLLFKADDQVVFLPGIQGGSGNGDDEKPTKPFRQISSEEKQKIAEIYQKNPPLKNLFDGSGWTLEEKRDLIQILLTRAGNLDQTLVRLPTALRALQIAGWTPDMQYALLTILAETSRSLTHRAYQNLPLVVEALEQKRWDREEQYALLSLIADRTGMHVDEAYGKIPPVLEALEITGWDLKDKYRFLHFLAERAGSGAAQALEGLPLTLAELKGIEGGFHKNFPFLSFLIINAGHRPPFFRDLTLRRVVDFNPLGRPSIPPVEIQPWRAFYPVRSTDGRKPSQGLIIPLRSAQTFPAHVELWTVKYVEGDRLILTDGERTGKENTRQRLFGQRIVKNSQGIYFPFEEGNKVVYWPSPKKGGGFSPWWKKIFGPFPSVSKSELRGASPLSMDDFAFAPPWKIGPLVSEGQMKMAGRILSRKIRIHPIFLDGLSYFLSGPPGQGDDGDSPPSSPPKSEGGPRKEADAPYRSSGLPKISQNFLEHLVELIQKNPTDIHGKVWALQETIRKSQLRNPSNFSSLLEAIQGSKALPSIKAVMAAKAAVAFQIQGPQEFQNVLKAIWGSGANPDSEVYALFDLTRNPYFQDNTSLSSLAAAIFASNARPDLIVKMLGEIGAKVSFEDPDFFQKILSQIRESLAGDWETIQQIGHVAGNPHFHEFQKIIQEIYDSTAGAEYKTIALYYLSQNSSLKDLDDLKAIIKVLPRGASRYYCQPLLEKIIRNPAFDTAYQRQVLGKIIQSSRLDSETKDFGIELLNRGSPKIQNEFYEVTSLGPESPNGFLVPLKPELPNVGEIWRIASLEGELITLHLGKKIIRPGIFKAIFWKRTLKIHPGKSGTISLKVGDPVAFLPGVQGGSGDPGAPSIRSLAKRARYDREAVRQLFVLYRDNRPSAGKALRDLDCRGYVDQAETDAEAVEILFYCRLAGNLLAEAKLRHLNVGHFSKAAYFNPASAFALEQLREAQNSNAGPILKTLDIFEHARQALAGNFLSAKALYLCAKAGNASARQALMRAAPRNPEAADFLQLLELPPGKPPAEIGIPGSLQEGGIAYLLPVFSEEETPTQQGRMRIVSVDPVERILTLVSSGASEGKTPLLFHFHYNLEPPLPFHVGDEFGLLRGLATDPKQGKL